MRAILAYFGSLIAVLLTTGCGNEAPLGAKRYASSDALFVQMEASLASSEALRKVTDIDHSRLDVTAGSTMPQPTNLIYISKRMVSL
jgi:hypothetical protein